MLTQFNKIVLIIATIVLIVMLVLLYIFLSKALFEDSYPPVVSDCPDYWDISLNSNGEQECIDNLKINSGSGASNCRNILPALFEVGGQHKDGVICNRYDIAKECNLIWDGITNTSKDCNKISSNL